MELRGSSRGPHLKEFHISIQKNQEKSPLEPENVGGNPGEDRAGRNHLLLYMK